MRWNRYQITLAVVMLASMALVVVSCYTASVGRDRGYTTIMVRNMSGVTATVRDPWGNMLGKVGPGVGKVTIRQSVHGWRHLFIGLTGYREDFPTWPENIESNRCWELEIEFMSPERSILTTFQPCMSQWATQRNAAILAHRMSAPDSVFEYRTRGEYRIADPTIQRILYLMTATCMDLPANRVLEVEWHVAAAIMCLPTEDYPLGRWIQGLYLDQDTSAVIILDEAFRYDPNTITHESLHHLTGLGDGEPEFEAARQKCEWGYAG